MIDDGDMSYPASPSPKEGGQRIRGIQRRVDLQCPYCRGEIEERRHVCSGCDTAYHTECWDRHGGCSLLGCEGSPQETSDSQQSVKTDGKEQEEADTNSQTGPFSREHQWLVDDRADSQRFLQKEKDQEAISEALGRQTVHIAASLACAAIVGLLAYAAHLSGASIDDCTVTGVVVWAFLALFVNTWIGITHERGQQGIKVDPNAPNVRRKLQQLRDLRNKPPDH